MEQAWRFGFGDWICKGKHPIKFDSRSFQTGSNKSIDSWNTKLGWDRLFFGKLYVWMWVYWSLGFKKVAKLRNIGVFWIK